MMKYNVSPDTLVLGDCDDCYVAPEVNYKFKKSPEGLYSGLLRILVEGRRRVRDLMKKYPEDSPEWVLLNERQRALKIMANAMYGYCGWLGARWYRREVLRPSLHGAGTCLRPLLRRPGPWAYQ